MVEILDNFHIIDETKHASIPKKVSLTKTIRFSESEADLWEFWNKDSIQEIKKILREKLTYKQNLRGIIKQAEDPHTEKLKLLKEKRELIKYMLKKEASQETLDRLSKEYFELQAIHL